MQSGGDGLAELGPAAQLALGVPRLLHQGDVAGGDAVALEGNEVRGAAFGEFERRAVEG